MKIFISADIEGITTTSYWEDCKSDNKNFPMHAKQMTDEVLACIEGAKNAGATEFWVNDAHGTGISIDPTRMPSGVSLLRGYRGHPYLMVEGVDNTFDAAMFIGYHSSAGRAGNPMAHTVSGNHVYIKVNGVIASEFLLYSYACALEGVPTVFLSGDEMLCEDFKDLHPNLITCAVKDGMGAMTRNYSPEDTLKWIKEKSEKSLKQDLSKALVKLPESFEIEIYFKEIQHAEKVSWFPGVEKMTDNIVKFKSDSYYEILRTIRWII